MRTFSRSSGELAWLATPDNAIEWNTLYNFWLDCDAAPVAGTVAIDRARPGAGAPSIAVNTQVPGALGNEHLGAGCGLPTPALVPSGLPTAPNPTFALTVQGQPFTIAVLAASLGGASIGLGGGCMSYLDNAQIFRFDYVVADVTGAAIWSLPIPTLLSPFDAWVQGAQLVPSGPILGVSLTNAIRLHVGGNACP